MYLMQVWINKIEEFYKPGGPYHIFAGKDCSVALAKMKLQDEFMNCYGTIELSEDEKKILLDWYDKLSKKYKVVGKLIWIYIYYT